MGSIKTSAISPREKVAIVRRLGPATLAMIVAMALTIRLMGIDWGLPYVFYPDEAVIVNHALAFGTGDLNPHYFIYPSLYMYVLSFVYGLSYVAGWVAGIFSSTGDFVRLFFNDATLFYLPGRLIAALSGVASVALVYEYGRRAYGQRVGLIAAAFLTFSVMHVEFSHYVKTHVPAGLLVMLSLYNAWQVYSDNDNRWRHYLLAGFFAGLAASTVYHAGFVLASLVTAHLLHWRDFSRKSVSNERLFSIRAFSAIGVCLLGFLLGTPFAILDWQTFIGDLSSTAGDYYQGNMWVQGTLFPFTSLLKTMGVPAGFLALSSLIYALFLRRSKDLVLLSFPLVLGGFLMLFASKEPHHMLVAFAPIYLLSAALLVDVASRSIRPHILQSATLAVAVVLFTIVPAKHSFEASYRLTLPDTRTLAKDWIERNIPPNSKVLMDSGKYYLGIYGPPLRLSRWTVEQFIARGESLDGKTLASRDGTRRVGYSGEAAYFRYQLQALDNQPGYDVIQILHDLGSPKSDVLSMGDYRAMGVEYVVTSSYARNNYSGHNEVESLYPNKAARYRHFYHALDKRLTLLKQFIPSPDAIGPTLSIYKLQ